LAATNGEEANMPKFDPGRLAAMTPPPGTPFTINKIGHVVLNCSDIEASTDFYTRVLGFKVSDVYGPEIAPGGMVFMRFNADHHGVALVGCMPGHSQNVELNHLAFEVGTLDEVFRARAHLEKHGVKIDFEGRRRAGVQIAVEFRDPDGHLLEIYWGLDQVGSEGHIRPASQWKWAHSLERAVGEPVEGQDTTVQDHSMLRKLATDETVRREAASVKSQTAKLAAKT
jgi:catechol 2,3-dioxygenase-like lactoylglutathione lyase family enzyme